MVQKTQNRCLWCHHSFHIYHIAVFSRLGWHKLLPYEFLTRELLHYNPARQSEKMNRESGVNVNTSCKYNDIGLITLNSAIADLGIQTCFSIFDLYFVHFWQVPTTKKTWYLYIKPQQYNFRLGDPSHPLIIHLYIFHQYCEPTASS